MWSLHRKAPVLESSLLKSKALRTATLLKRYSSTGFLLWILIIIQKYLFFVEDLYRAGSETQCAFLSTPFFTEHLQWLFLTVSGFQPEDLLKKELQQRRFYLNFSKLLRIFFYRTPPDDCFLCLTIILRSFSDHLFYRAPLQNCLFHVQVAELQTPDTMKSISKGLFKHFIQTRDVAIPRRWFTLNPWKLSVNKLIYNEVARCQHAI